MRKTIIIHIFFAIISAIVYAEGILTKGPDLIWNMFLALVAYDAAFIAIQFKKKWFFLPIAILWLVFYPNTFYMITDLVHMHWVSDTLWNRESLHLFMAFVPSIFFGVLCGIESWNLISGYLKLRWWLEYLVIGAVSFLSSLAIYIGRYDRLNSWDLVSHPTLVFERLAAALQRERLLFILGFTFIQIMSLFFLSKNQSK